MHLSKVFTKREGKVTMAKIKDKAKLFSMSYRRRESFKQAEGNSKRKHSAKNVFLCEAQLALFDVLPFPPN